MAKRARAAGHEAEATSDTRGGRGTPRATWTGSISFGLLQIPISLVPAESRAEEIHFRMLDKKDLSPVKFLRVNAETGKEVAWNDIVKGYEIEKDEFVVLEKVELAKANVKATQTIDIQDFVPLDQIDPAFFETPYFVVPQKRASKAYVLLRDALAKKNAVAIATFVLRTKEHLVALMPVGDAIMLEVLRFGHELRDVEDFPIPHTVDVAAREKAMAEQLIEGMMRDFEPTKYKDRFHRDVMAIIREKAKTGEVTEHHAKQEGTVATDVVDLLELLKASVSKGKPANAHRGPRKTKTRARRKKAA